LFAIVFPRELELEELQAERLLLLLQLVDETLNHECFDLCVLYGKVLTDDLLAGLPPIRWSVVAYEGRDDLTEDGATLDELEVGRVRLHDRCVR
jgi:hypothetical protein